MSDNEQEARPTRWDGDQMTLALSHTLTLEIPKQHLNDAGDFQLALNSARSELVREFRRTLEERHDLRIEVQDIQVLEYDDEPTTYDLRADWHPASESIECVGGPMDGLLMDVKRVGEPVYWCGDLAHPQLATGDDDLAGRTVLAMYRLGGWCETSRRWLYREPKD